MCSSDPVRPVMARSPGAPSATGRQSPKSPRTTRARSLEQSRFAAFGTRRIQLVREERTRRVQLVREGGGGGGRFAAFTSRCTCSSAARPPLSARGGAGRGGAGRGGAWGGVGWGRRGARQRGLALVEEDERASELAAPGQRERARRAPARTARARAGVEQVLEGAAGEQLHDEGGAARAVRALLEVGAAEGDDVRVPPERGEDRDLLHEVLHLRAARASSARGKEVAAARWWWRVGGGLGGGVGLRGGTFGWMGRVPCGCGRDRSPRGPGGPP